MEGVDNMDFDMMLSYALATENDAISDLVEPIRHILKEEKEHALMLKQILNGEDIDLDH